MIYQPQPFFNVYAALGQGVLAALARLAADYVTGQGKPWAYYLGYGFGGSALATGIPGANAILYVVGTGALKLFFEQSPGAADVRIFLDGVESAELQLNGAVVDVIEYALSIPNDGVEHAIMLLNLGTPGSVPDPTDWLSILAIEAANSIQLEPKEFLPMPVVLISATIKDAKTTSNARVKNTQSVAVFVDQGTQTIADLTEWHDKYLLYVDGVTDGLIIGSEMTFFPALPSGMKSAPVAGSDVQEGGLLSFSLTGSQYKDSIRVPAWKQSLFGADGQSIANSGATALLTGLLLGTASAPADFAATDRNAIAYLAFLAGRKSFRK